MSDPAASEAISARVCRIVAAYVRPELGRSVEFDAELEADLKLDGLDRQSIALDLDEAFGISISDEQLEGWATVGDILSTVALWSVAAVSAVPA